MEEIYMNYLGRFEEKFEGELAQGRIGEYHCFDTLRALDEALRKEGKSPEERRSLLSHLAEVLVSYVESRLSHEARRVYDQWHGNGRIDSACYGTIRDEMLFFDECFKSVYEELERFNHINDDKLIDGDKLQKTREDLVRFEQLIQTYVRLLELQVASGSADSGAV